mmetsp:Transcript_7799/g.21697  ORF Transcript_7799/g.21697 Transcript_7799/m.21697 type:complete len:159 (-) Transcript_7799:245-721(-)
MLNMCERWKQNRPPGSTESYRRYTDLGNLMFILAFGEAPGQFRHIDNIDPNNQICCYMSEKCPSTIVYELGGPDISCGEDLLSFWEEVFDDDAVPNLVREMLASKSDERLDDEGFAQCPKMAPMVAAAIAFASAAKPRLPPPADMTRRLASGSVSPMG